MLSIPQAALTQHIIAFGKPGAGKSTSLRTLVEHLLDEHKPVCIVDPKGDWWGLKSSADGKRAGYPIVIFGGEHADVPINAHSGAHVAELIATGNRPALIDLGGWMIGERTRFFIEFASTFFKLARGARHLVIDEVHNFAPQGKVMDPDAGKMLHWANRLASEGRGKGITLIAASQRPQKVHKDFVTSCETLIALRVIHKLDRDAIKDWIDGCADPAAGKQVLTELASMKRGEAWVWSPEIGFGPQRVKFPMFSTYDSFKPQAADAGKLKGWAEVDLEDVKAKLVALVEEAAANDPAQLKARIRQLEQKVATIGSVPTRQEDLQAAERRGYLAGVQQIGDMHRATVLRVMTEFQQVSHRYIDFLRADLPAEPAPPVPKSLSSPATLAPVVARDKEAATPPTSSTDQPPVQQRILNALAELEQLGAREPRRELLAFMSGYSNLTSTGFAKAMSGLSTAGLIRYPNQGFVALTADGRQKSMPPARPTSAAELQRRIVDMVGGAAGRILKPLIDAYPSTVSRERLAEAAGYGNLTSTGFAKAMSRLSTLGFLHYPERGMVAAKPVLFLQ